MSNILGWYYCDKQFPPMYEYASIEEKDAKTKNSVWQGVFYLQ